MNKDVYLYWALAFNALAIFSASVSVPPAAVISAIAAAVMFIRYKVRR